MADGAGRTLVRIVDPAGLAIAWFDPDSACCVGFMVRVERPSGTAWLPVLAAPGERQAGAHAPGCAVLVVAEAARFRWHVVERDPTAVTLVTGLSQRRDEGEDHAANVSGTLTAQLEDATLSLALTVRNDGIKARPVAFGLRPALAQENDSPQLLVQRGDGRILLELPAGGPETPDRGRMDQVETQQVSSAPRVAQVVVACDEGVRYVWSQVPSAAGSVVLDLLGSPPGEMIVLPPGVSARLAITVAVGSVRGSMER